ncbi:hypothetical protein [Streptomyces sp. DSM 41634]|uniref:hypothetical protein n=1 Tax=Streptomyces sp. DSM 41634 TaxID=3448656 RepID=UPI0040401649
MSSRRVSCELGRFEGGQGGGSLAEAVFFLLRPAVPGGRLDFRQERLDAPGLLIGHGLVQAGEQLPAGQRLLLHPGQGVAPGGVQLALELRVHPGQLGDFAAHLFRQVSGIGPAGVEQPTHQLVRLHVLRRFLLLLARSPQGGRGRAPGLDDPLDRRGGKAPVGDLAFVQGEPLGRPGERLGADPDPAGGAFAVQTDAVHVPTADQGI